MSKTNKVVVFSAAQILNLVIAFLISPYLARALPKEVYSAYNQVIIYVSLANVLFSLGIQAVVFYFFSKPDGDKDKTISSLQFLIFFISVISSVSIFLLSILASKYIGNDLIAENLGVCSAASGLTFVYNYFVSLLLYNNKTKRVAVFTVICSAFSVSLIFISLNIWNSISWALFSSQVVSPLLGIVLFFSTSARFLRWSIRPYLLSIKEILRVSVPLYVTSLLGSSYTYISAFFVIYLIGDVEFANYRNGAIEIPFISTLAFSISSVLLPDLNKYFHSGDVGSALKLKKTIINQCIFLLYPVIIFFIIFHNEFIIAYFSDKYAESAIIFAIYSFTCFIRINDYQDVLITSGNSAYILRANLYYFFINLVSVFALGYLFGIIGVAVAASFSVFMLAYILLKKDASIFKIRFIEFFEWQKIIRVVILSFFISIALKYAINHYNASGHIFNFIIGAVIYFPLVYLYILRNKFLIASIEKILFRVAPFLKYFISK